MHCSALSLGLVSLAPTASAWGNLGHETIAYVATDFVSSKTKTWAQKILGDSSTDYLANVATSVQVSKNQEHSRLMNFRWADTYKYTSAGSFSEPFHFIDANDSPPETCNVDYDRDCADTNCVVSAIVNYVCVESCLEKE